MKWADYATNRFGGRLTGSDAYTNAAEWALWQFKEWGVEAYLDEVGEVPVGFNRGPWFGKMVVPEEKALYFGTPSFTAGTKGVQRGRLVILHADPFSIPGRRPSPEDVEAKRAAVEAAIAEVKSDLSKFDGAWVLIAGENSGWDGRFTALGRVVAGAHVLGDFAAGDEIRSIRILRSGEAARAFVTDDEAFQRLLRGR